MARPKKLDEEKRSCQRNIRFTDAEDAFLIEQAATAGLSVSEYLRAITLGRRLKPAPSPVSAALVQELNAVGVNLNQITKYLHAGRPLSVQAEGIFAKLESVIDRLLAESHGS